MSVSMDSINYGRSGLLVHVGNYCTGVSMKCSMHTQELTQSLVQLRHGELPVNTDTTDNSLGTQGSLELNTVHKRIQAVATSMFHSERLR
jgi:hypothetical protein